MPIQVIKLDPQNNLMRVSYSEIVENPKPPTETSWYYSTYQDQYPIKEREVVKIIEAGKPAPSWKLPVFGTTDSVALQQLKGKVVMLEFWIAHCGPCITSVPKLNNLGKKYEKDGLVLLALNAHDSKEVIEAFVSYRKPAYTVLHQGEAAAKDYGVIGFPSVVLINKEGVVFYAGNFVEEKVEQLIQANL